MTARWIVIKIIIFSPSHSPILDTLSDFQPLVALLSNSCVFNDPPSMLLSPQKKMSPNRPKNAPKFIFLRCIFAFFSVACTLKGKTTYCVVLGFSIDFFVLFNTSPLPITSDHLTFACDPPNWDNWDNFWQFWKDSPGDLWHLRHWLQFWQLRTWMHDNLWYQTINCDTGQHSQFLRCSLTKPSNSHKGNEL